MNDEKEQKKPSRLEWARFIVGALLFVGLIVINVWVKELSLFIIGIPALLMGIDPKKLLGGGK